MNTPLCTLLFIGQKIFPNKSYQINQIDKDLSIKKPTLSHPIIYYIRITAFCKRYSHYLAI